MYLADGGLTENLGFLALSTRRCQRILVVDAEYDPDYQFGAYVRLRRILRESFRVSLELPELDKLLNVKGIDDEAKGELCGGKGCRTGSFDGARNIFMGTVNIPGYEISQTDFAKGSVIKRTEKVADFTGQVAYLKLSINSKLASVEGENGRKLLEEEYPDAVSTFIGAHRVEPCLKGDLLACQSPFPQLSTSYQIFEKAQMKAYIELGAHSIKKLWWK